MIGQIGYLGQVSPRTGRLAVGLLAIGCALGGAAAGAILGACGWVLLWLVGVPGGAGNHMVLVPVGALALIGGLRDLKLLRLPFPQPTCQVPQYWRDALAPLLTSFLWGLFIGSGIRTRYQYAILHVLGLWILLAGSPLWGAGLLGLYGAAHGAALAGASALQRVPLARSAIENLPHRTQLFFTVSGACLVWTGTLLLALVSR